MRKNAIPVPGYHVSEDLQLGGELGQLRPGNGHCRSDDVA